MYGKHCTSELLPFTFGTQNCPIETNNEPPKPVAEAELNDWQAQWNTSCLRRQLISFFGKYAQDGTARIDQIICFGLGCLLTVCEGWPEVPRRAYLQHLAACTIRDTLATYLDGNRPKIYAQDPSYTLAEEAYLLTHMNITVLPDPEGFKALNGNTLVLSFAPNVPVRQIALDMTHGSNGPAGIFCDAIKDDGLGCDGKGTSDDGLRRNVCPFSTDPSSPGLWKYKQESVSIEFEDKRDDGFGNIAVGVYLKKVQ
ncbi:hypothetical protein EK21DRAFT_68733 [Setomelanomma holmii]|uniref:SRR1-like domain-containing protein n=1 Tax=Setomelanomma holmii TaxID=210430 RepID=A0A9P4H769_9PLEO|nr:hypothetical protein EK21DRAFT_68733 [Setomelanomma holmii]